MGETAKELKSLQPGIFERLADEILRYQPGYEGLVTCGLNEDDRAVADPLDGILRVPGSEPPIFVAFAHTAEKSRARLREKWLHEPTPRSRKGPGDVVKAAAELRKARELHPNAVLRLVLTSQVEPPSELVPQVEAYCRDRDMALELWPGSRLCSFLDNTGQGNWLRRQYLGIDAELLSLAQLRELSATSLANYERSVGVTPLAPVVHRSAFQELKAQVFGGRDRIRFVVAESGFGKSVAALWLFRQHLEAGGCGLWIQESIVEQRATLQGSLESYLRELAPKLAAGCGAQALELCKVGGLLVVVDDVSRSSSPSRLLHLLTSWSEIAGEQTWPDKPVQSFDWRPWHLVAPVWPHFVDQVEQHQEKRLSALCFHLGAMTREESVQALLVRANATNTILSEVQANDLAEQCGNDPLLVGLVNLCAAEGQSRSAGQPASIGVVESFVEKCIRRLAEDGTATGGEYLGALVQLGWWMLQSKNLDPEWSEVSSDAHNSNELPRLRKLAAQRAVFSLQGVPERETVRFRHDRVRDYVCAKALHRSLCEGRADEEVLADPYFAEIIGQALVMGELEEIWATRVREANPLALFTALRLFGEPSTAMEQAVVREIHTWLEAEVVPGKCMDWLLLEVQGVLRRTDSPLVLKICRKFRDFPWYVLEAQFRNGDVRAGAEFLGRQPLGLPFRDTQRLIEHVRQRFGKRVLDSLVTLLHDQDIDKVILAGALALAGHLGTPELATAISDAWKTSTPDTGLLASFIWAGARCAPERPAQLLGPMIEVWRQLPEAAKEPPSTPESMDVSDYLRYGFRKPCLAPQVVEFLQEQAVASLEQPIFWLFQGMDDAAALEASVPYFAERPGYVGAFLHLLPAGLHRETLSHESLRALQELWLDESRSDAARRLALRLWQAASTGPTLGSLLEIKPDSPIFDQAIRYRALQGDHTATQGMIHAIRTAKYPTYCWGDVAAIWNPVLMAELDAYLGKLRSSLAPGEWELNGLEHETAELLIAIPAADAEVILGKHWSHLRFRKEFVQAALRIATDKTCLLAGQVLASCPSPRDLLRYIASKMATIRRGREQPVEQLHLDALRPFLQLLHPNDLHSLWDICNRQRYFAFRRAYIDPLLSPEDRLRHGVGVEGKFAKLDHELTHGGGPFWIKHEFERAEIAGETWAEFLTVLLQWAQARGSLEALKVVAEAIAQFGSRAELAVLDTLEVPQPDVASRIRAETRFRVQRRILG